MTSRVTSARRIRLYKATQYVCTVYVESVDGRKSQATGIVPNDNVLGCPETRKGRADRLVGRGLLLNRFSI